MLDCRASSLYIDNNDTNDCTVGNPEEMKQIYQTSVRPRRLVVTALTVGIVFMGFDVSDFCLVRRVGSSFRLIIETSPSSAPTNSMLRSSVSAASTFVWSPNNRPLSSEGKACWALSDTLRFDGLDSPSP